MIPEDEPLPDFSNRAVTFYIADTPIEYAVTLQSPIFERQAGRWFVVGRRVSTGSEDWTAGASVAIAWDGVLQYMVFDSAEDFTRRLASSPGGFRGIFGSR